MTFVTAGLAVAGAAAIAIPIIIHLLFRQRRRPIEWAAMRFLIEAFKKQKRRLQIEQLLLLVTRCLIVLVLGFALARPLLESAGILEDDTGRVVLLVIDNGLASAVREGQSPDATALRGHVDRAVRVINALGEGESVGVILAARPVEAPILPPSLDHAAVIDVLESLDPSDTPTDIAAALRMAREATAEIEDEGRAAVVYLFSDFRAGSAALDTPLPRVFDRTDDRVVLLAAPPAAEATTNYQVVDVSPIRRVILPGAVEGAQQVTVMLARHGGSLGTATTRVRLVGDATAALPAQEVKWAPGRSEATVTFTLDIDVTIYEQVALTAIIEPASGAQGGDALPTDNRRHATIEVRDGIRIAMISPPTFERVGMIEHLTPGQWIRRALQTSEASPMDVIDVAPASLDAVDLRGVDAAILMRPDRLIESGWMALRSFVDRGGLLIIIPPHEVNVHPWTDQLATALELPWRIALEVNNFVDGLLMADAQPRTELLRMLEAEINGLTRPIVTYKTLPVVMTETRATPVLLFEDGSPAMIMSSPGASAADETDGADEPRDRHGLVVYLAMTPISEWTTLPVNAAMVPLVQEIVRQGMSMIRATQMISAGEQAAIPGLDRGATSLRTPDGQSIALDPLRRPSRPLRQAGLYQVVDQSSRPGGHIAVNIDPRAGRTDTQSEAAVSAWLSDSGAWRVFERDNPAAMLATTEGGTSIAGKLLLLLLLLAVAETILARRFSHAYRRGRAKELQTGLRPSMQHKVAAAGS